MKKTNFMIISAVMLFLLASCNWDVLSNKVSEISGGDYTSTSFDIFTGEAPRNLVSSKAASTTDIGLSFSPVKGADYYLVYRADIPRKGDTSEIDPDSLKWVRISRVEPVSSADNRKLSIVDSINDDFESSNGEGKDLTKFLYRVQAGSVYTDTYYPIEGKMSDIVIGYTLAPPSGMTSSAGDFEDRIELTWQQSDGAQSYDLYYTDDVTKDNIDEIMRTLKSIARDLDLPILVLSQLSRDNEKGKRQPMLSDLRDSGSIEQDADVVMLLHRDAYQKTNQVDQNTIEANDSNDFSNNDTIHVNVAKNRQGPTGEFLLSFLMNISKFVELTTNSFKQGE